VSEGHTLRELLADVAVVSTSGDLDVLVTAVEIDSRLVKPGAVFVALLGERHDGHDFIEQALQNGAVAVVAENQSGRMGREVRETLVAPPTRVFVKDSRGALSAMAAAFYDYPSQAMRVIGVTGTNGKTTTTHMIAGILEAAGMPAGIIGTIGARFGERTWKLANTTPLPPELQKLLAEMRDGGARAVAMEVSSHALALERVEDVRFAIGAFTNLTRDHLDFHETEEAYAAAKHRLFELAERCVFNLDDAYGVQWAAEFDKPMLTYSLGASGDIVPGNLEMRGDGSTFVLDGTQFAVRIPGRFNVSNALCAIACARLLGIDDGVAARGLLAVDCVPGRMEHVRAEDGSVDVVVDYAHTPDSLENVLRTLRDGAKASLVVVFGCGGNRDRGKRAQMGEIAARLADRVYITSDNPRTEDPRAIADEILGGIQAVSSAERAAPIVIELDRREAIERAVLEAQRGDAILIAGKGHEDYQIIGNTVFPFDDVVVAREALALRSVKMQGGQR